MNSSKTWEGKVVAYVFLLLTIVGWGIWFERTVAKKNDLINSQIVQMEVNRILLLAPYDGRIENAPPNVRATHDMLELESTRLRGG